MKNWNKTEEELKAMSEDELMEYLDAKAEYLKQHSKPLSSYKTKRFAYISSAISKQDADYDKIKKIAKENEQSAMEQYFKDKNKK